MVRVIYTEYWVECGCGWQSDAMVEERDVKEAIEKHKESHATALLVVTRNKLAA
jgi:hypothetical protein